jgi:hypothetical protein
MRGEKNPLARIRDCYTNEIVYTYAKQRLAPARLHAVWEHSRNL